MEKIHINHGLSFFAPFDSEVKPRAMAVNLSTMICTTDGTEG